MVSLPFSCGVFLYRFNHIIDGCHARRSGFVQVNIDAFVVVQRNLEHGIEGFFHRAIDTGRVQPADVMRPPPASLRALRVPISTAANRAAGRRRFHTRSPPDVAPAPPANFADFFRPETGSILQWLRAMVVPFDCNKSISFFCPLLSVRLQLRQHFLLEFDHVLGWWCLPGD